MCLSCSPSADAANEPRDGPTHGQRRGPTHGPARFELVLLGTEAGPPIQPDRTGIASALVVDGHVYLVDRGRAAATQYVRAGLRLSSLAAIFLTHLHADHYNVFMLGGYPGRNQAPTVAPADPTPGTVDMTAKLISAYAYSTNAFIRESAYPDVRDLILTGS